MKCEICGQGPQTGVTVYRINPKGEKGRWRCQFHIPAEKMPDEEVFVTVAILERIDRAAQKGGQDADA